MSQNQTRMIVIVAAVLLCGWVVSNPSRFRLGPDLAGGTILIYQKAENEKGPATNIEKLLPALKERLDPAGLYNYVIRALGTDRVEIIMPEALSEDVDRVKRLVSTVGQLQFKIVAHNRRHRELMDRAVDAWPNKLVGQEGTFVRYGAWLPVDPNLTGNKDAIDKANATEAGPNKLVVPQVRYRPRNEFPENLDLGKAFIKKGPDGGQYVLARWDNDKVLVDEGALALAGSPEKGTQREEIARAIRAGRLTNLVMEDEAGDRYVLMYNDPYDVTGEYLERAEPTNHDGSPAVAFSFNAVGARKFLDLTTEFQPEKDGTRFQLGVVLDNRVRSDPNLNQRISSNGVISGNFSRDEVDELVQILDAGQLPFALDKEPSSQFQIAPTLGRDTIERATYSIGISLVAVIAFVIVYYRVAGVIAIIGLLINMLFTVALMVFFRATWTLPGLAGLVLTVGMSVDANILIFERMREELDRGASIAMAIRNGYEKAFSAILDGNLTTIVTAIILFWIGTDQVKGFAVTLILGIITSMFCALVITRVIFDLLLERRLLRRLRMLRIMSNPNYDFLSYKKIWYGISATLIVLGIIAIVARGRNNFDIDFTGGTMVGVRFKSPLTIGQVRKMASEAAGLPDVSVEEVRLQGADAGTYYVIRTTARDAKLEEGRARAETVGGKLATAFKDYLIFIDMSAGPPKPIAAAAPGATQDPALAAFVGGHETTLSFNPPVTPDYVRNQLADLLLKTAPDQDPTNLYSLIPIESTRKTLDDVTGAVAFGQYRLATRLDLASLTGSLKSQIAASPAFEQFNQFGPQVAEETQRRALGAIFLSWVSIIVYVWFRFGSWTFGLAGVVALVHDVLIALGMTALVSILAANFPFLSVLTLTDMKINLNGIAAVLTLIGFSINDTIVIFDRIREVRGKSPRLTPEIVNRSVNETLSRTIFTSLTVLMAVVILYLGCGVDLRGFAFILVVGVLTGVYSTIYIANPVLLALTDWQENRKRRSASAPAPAVSTR